MFFDGEECAGVVILLSELSLCVTFWDGRAFCYCFVMGNIISTEISRRILVI